MGWTAEAVWNSFFTIANPFYTFENFLRAASRFPAFCNELHVDEGWTLDEMCQQELITLFAQIQTETGKHETAGVYTDTYGLYCIE